MQQTFDRAAEDLGNVIHFEHVNVTIPDQRLATLFYVAGLGLTRDPYLMTSDNNMWVNVGRSQFHLPTGNPQVLRGHTGIVIPDREALLVRLAAVRKKLEGTRFGFAEHNDYVDDFSGPHKRLGARNLVWSEDNQYQYRFRDIVDLESGRHLFTIEHEVRSYTHPMFLRPLVNRNAIMSNRNYAAGHDQWQWAM